MGMFTVHHFMNSFFHQSDISTLYFLEIQIPMIVQITWVKESGMVGKQRLHFFSDSLHKRPIPKDPPYEASAKGEEW